MTISFVRDMILSSHVWSSVVHLFLRGNCLSFLVQQILELSASYTPEISDYKVLVSSQFYFFVLSSSKTAW